MNPGLRFDLPQLAEAYVSSIIVTAWYPKRHDPSVQGVQMGHQQMGFVAGINLIREFSPELKRSFGNFKPRQPISNREGEPQLVTLCS